VKETVARTLCDTIRAALPPETAFILVLQDGESGGLVSNLATPEEVSRVLHAVAEEHSANYMREADEHEARGGEGH
jgi:hypothetical protein